MELLLENSASPKKNRKSTKATEAPVENSPPANDDLLSKFELILQDVSPNQTKVKFAVVNDNWSICYNQDKNNNPEWDITDSSGHKVTGNVNGISINGIALNQALTYAGKKSIDPQYTKADSISLSDALKILGESPNRANDIYTSLNAKNLWNNNLLTSTESLIPRFAKSVSLNGDTVTIEAVSGTIEIETVQSDGTVLSPASWKIVRAPWVAPSKDNESLAIKGVTIPSTQTLLQNSKGDFKIVDSVTGKVLHGEGSGGAVCNPLIPGEVISLSPNGKAISRIQVGEDGVITTELMATKFEGAVKSIKLSPEGRFLYAEVGLKNEGSIKAIDLQNGNVVGEIPNVSSLLHVDQAGTVVFIDTQSLVRKVSSNARSLGLRSNIETQRGDQKRSSELDALFSLRDSIATISLPNLREIRRKEVETKQVSEAEVKADIARELEEKFAPDIATIKTVEDALLFERQLRALAVSDAFQGNEEAFAPLAQLLQEKLNQVRLTTFTVELESVATVLNSAASPREVVEIGTRYDDLLRERRNIVIRDLVQREEIDSQLERVASLRTVQLEKLVKNVEGGIQNAYRDITKLVNAASNQKELDAIADEPVGKSFRELLELAAATELGARYRENFDELFEGKQSELQNRAEVEENRERLKIAQLLQNSRGMLDDISRAIPDQVKTTTDLSVWLKRAPIVTEYRASILALPEQMRSEEELRFDRVVSEFREKIRQNEISKTMRSGKEAVFGEIKFPVFEPAPYVWSPKVISVDKRTKSGKLVFEDSIGRRFVPENESVPSDLTDPKTADAVSRFEGEASIYFSRFEHKTPPFDPKWAINDHVEKGLSEMARLLHIQQRYHRSIVILEGEAGTGKNVLVDIFCHLTNRQSSTFSCHAQAEKEDLTYAFRFDPKKGTYQVDSRFIEALQTPGAVVVLDEINTLPPEVCKMLNPLLDYRRALFLPDGRVVKAHPSVLLVGTMNPQHYLGVKPLSQEVKSRARIMTVDYPPEKNGKKFTPYEAEMLSSYRPSLASLGKDNFAKGWNYVVNSDAANGADRFLNPDMIKDIQNLHQIVKTANRVREAYAAYRAGVSNDAVEFVFSLRESTDIAIELDWEEKVRKAIKSIVIPKISDHAEKKRVEVIIENA